MVDFHKYNEKKKMRPKEREIFNLMDFYITLVVNIKCQDFFSRSCVVIQKYEINMFPKSMPLNCELDHWVRFNWYHIIVRVNLRRINW